MITKIPAGTRLYLTKKNNHILCIQPDMTLFDDIMYVAYDIKIDGKVAIPKGTRVVGDWVTESCPTHVAQLQLHKIYLKGSGQDFSADSDVLEDVSNYNSSELCGAEYMYKQLHYKSIANIMRRIIKSKFKTKTLADNNRDTSYLEINTKEIPASFTSDFIIFPDFDNLFIHNKDHLQSPHSMPKSCQFNVQNPHFDSNSDSESCNDLNYNNCNGSCGPCGPDRHCGPDRSCMSGNPPICSPQYPPPIKPCGAPMPIDNFTNRPIRRSTRHNNIPVNKYNNKINGRLRPRGSRITRQYEPSLYEPSLYEPFLYEPGYLTQAHNPPQLHRPPPPGAQSYVPRGAIYYPPAPQPQHYVQVQPQREPYVNNCAGSCGDNCGGNCGGNCSCSCSC